ncbi:hypothetical protein BU24DRAFT_451550 [Aaosphaeria arxii CBS 175.79]|uniref:Alpha-acetolactate decarboxylase n=1 Tax=Aaosphaeria arxii CBS 175.79 TaxID=1450172 RepID=A0A6A5XNQ2_9PLEO|nr:uncharacterized protein BU24DRAFT_451550 [Aaosphaeria arxii CBS 175.79]KAF2014536.1 hypothetical protein BU24DRAFT_451550 [Aaosphaeria arxii CBS 175.79]
MVALIPNDVFQFSTHSALTDLTSGKPLPQDLSSHGDFGLCAFSASRPLLLIAGAPFIVDEACNLHPVAPADERLAFAMVSVFRPDSSLMFPNGKLTRKTLGTAFDEASRNSICPFSFQASFTSVKLSSNATGSEDGVVARELKDVEGFVFGYAVPEWMRGICGPRVFCWFVASGGSGDDGRPGGRAGGWVVDFEGTGEVEVR